MSSTQSQTVPDSGNQEDRIQAALIAYNNGSVSSMRGAARSFHVPVNTLRRRAQGATARAKTRANSHKFTQSEEDSLTDQINSMISRGSPPSRHELREMADALLATRGDAVPAKVGHRWVDNFIKRIPSLAAHYLRGGTNPVATRPAPKEAKPKDAKDFERQALAIISSLRPQFRGSSNTLLKSLQQMTKAYQEVLLEIARLERENKRLHTENVRLGAENCHAQSALNMNDGSTNGS